ncbi:MAG: hypothetical protein IT359_04115 [Gemmatimonadaceae bacterium]|nr:hypothetical protein [Gemmatimonadaceae bacterium]
MRLATVLVALLLSAPAALAAPRLFPAPPFVGPCPSSVIFGGQTSVYGIDYWVYGTAVVLQHLSPGEDALPRAKYSFPPGWFYNSVLGEGHATSKMKASATRTKCIDMTGWWIHVYEYYENLTIASVTQTDEFVTCADGSHVDDPSGCPTSGGGGGGGGGEGGGGGGGSGTEHYYYICYITYWSDNTEDWVCYGPYNY